VTAADLSGKTICWNSGNVVTYHPDGRRTTNRGGHGMWWVPEPGVFMFSRIGNVTGKVYGPFYRQEVVLPDGSFHTQQFFGQSGGSLTTADLYVDDWGTFCH
jgi:hypothetical protein